MKRCPRCSAINCRNHTRVRVTPDVFAAAERGMEQALRRDLAAWALWLAVTPKR